MPDAALHLLLLVQVAHVVATRLRTVRLPRALAQPAEVVPTLGAVHVVARLVLLYAHLHGENTTTRLLNNDIRDNTNELKQLKHITHNNRTLHLGHSLVRAARGGRTGGRTGEATFICGTQQKKTLQLEQLVESGAIRLSPSSTAIGSVQQTHTQLDCTRFGYTHSSTALGSDQQTHTQARAYPRARFRWPRRSSLSPASSAQATRQTQGENEKDMINSN